MSRLRSVMRRSRKKVTARYETEDTNLKLKKNNSLLINISCRMSNQTATQVPVSFQGVVFRCCSHPQLLTQNG